MPDGTYRVLLNDDVIKINPSLNKFRLIDTESISLSWRVLDLPKLAISFKPGDVLYQWFKPPVPVRINSIRIWNLNADQSGYEGRANLRIWTSSYNGEINKVDCVGHNENGYTGRYDESMVWQPGTNPCYTDDLLDSLMWGTSSNPVNFSTPAIEGWMEIELDTLFGETVFDSSFVVAFIMTQLQKPIGRFAAEDEGTLPYHFFKSFVDENNKIFAREQSMWMEVDVEFIEDPPPFIQNVTTFPIQVGNATGAFIVDATIFDVKLDSIMILTEIMDSKLIYEINNNPTVLQMDLIDDSTFSATIPPTGTFEYEIVYRIEAEDSLGSVSSAGPWTILGTDFPSKEILVVYDGGDFNLTTFDRVWLRLLNGSLINKYDYYLWDVGSLKAAPETLASWQIQPKAILWYGGSHGIQFIPKSSGPQMNYLAAYIDNGGQFMLQAQDYIGALYEFDPLIVAIPDSDFFYTHLGVYQAVNDVQDIRIRGKVDGNGLTEDSIFVRELNYVPEKTMGYVNYSDIILEWDQNALPVIWNNFDQPVGIRFEPSNGGKTIFIGLDVAATVPVDSINYSWPDPHDRFLFNVLEWFNVSSLPVIVRPLSNAGPSNYFLAQNYPNPFNAQTTFEYGMSRAGSVSIKIYNILGQKVRTLVHKFHPKGYHTVKWDGKNDFGIQVASGIYYYQIKVNNFINTKQMIHLK